VEFGPFCYYIGVMELFKSTARIVYDPKRGNMKRRTKWWCVANADPEIARYYRWWVERHFWGRTAIHPKWIHQPAWGAHISVVRGEQPRPQYLPAWNKLHGETVEFEYEPIPILSNPAHRKNKDGDFWYIHAFCPTFDQIRDELGLRTFHRFHMTVGRVY